MRIECIYADVGNSPSVKGRHMNHPPILHINKLSNATSTTKVLK